ncbi:MAG TPA: hypothetical protein VGW40_12675 [Allosphingosinicella sp.]|nr:hypothetical protein [Allosphingosinicella sp.]
MAASAAVSVASFSVVLAETFAAIGASTLVPATFIAGLKVAKAAATPAATGAKDSAKAPVSLLADDTLEALGSNPLKPVFDALGNGLAKVDEVQLLLPHDAKLHAEFEFEARDRISVGGSVSGLVQVVTVNAGFSALYESRSKNKITLDMNFVAVNVAL